MSEDKIKLNKSQSEIYETRRNDLQDEIDQYRDMLQEVQVRAQSELEGMARVLRNAQDAPDDWILTEEDGEFFFCPPEQLEEPDSNDSLKGEDNEDASSEDKTETED